MYIYIYLFNKVLDSDAIIIYTIIVASLVLLKCYWSSRGTKKHIMIYGMLIGYNLYKHDCWESSGLVGKRWWVQSTNCIVCFRRVWL